jgi:hypothetical protein
MTTYDDVLIFSQTLDDHINRINLVLSRLAEYGATVKLNKCNYF